MAEMVTAQKAVKQYDNDINAYIACIKLEYDDSVKKVGKPGDKPTADSRRHRRARRPCRSRRTTPPSIAAGVADRFNEQVRIFKAKAADQKK